MHALIESAVERRKITIRELFRYAYIRRFQKDIPSGSLDDDVRKYESDHSAPPYVVAYMVELYSDNKEQRKGV